MTYSLRARLMAGIAAGILLLLCFFSIFVYSTTRFALISQFDKALLNTAILLTAVITEEDPDEEQRDHREEEEYRPEQSSEDNGVAREDLPGRNESQEIGMEFDIRMTPEFRARGGGYYCIYNREEDIVIQSPSYKDLNPPLPEGLSRTPRYDRCVLPDGRPGRTVGFRFNLENDENEGQYDYIVVLSRDAGSLYQYLSFLRGLLLLAGGIVVGLSVVIARVVAGRGLRPVKTLGERIAGINADNLGKGHLAGDYPVELRPMVGCLNSLLERLRQSFALERRFTADVAHELRTPVAGLQSSLDVCLSRPRDSQDYRAVMQDCLVIVRSMNRMIDSLLSIARLDAHQVMLKIEPIPLQVVIDSCWAIHADRAAERQIAFSHTIANELVIHSDMDYLTMILSNVLDNAADYTNSGGRIWMTAALQPDGIRLSLFNTGCAIKPEDIHKVFSPFWQNDPSRSATGHHCGIGLTIVQKMVRVLSGQVNAEVVTGGVFAIHIDLPAQ